jgi:hypothetical protein
VKTCHAVIVFDGKTWYITFVVYLKDGKLVVTVVSARLATIFGDPVE